MANDAQAGPRSTSANTARRALLVVRFGPRRLSLAFAGMISKRKQWLHRQAAYNWLWPQITDLESAAVAGREGAAAAFVVAGITKIFSVLSYSTSSMRSHPGH